MLLARRMCGCGNTQNNCGTVRCGQSATSADCNKALDAADEEGAFLHARWCHALPQQLLRGFVCIRKATCV